MSGDKVLPVLSCKVKGDLKLDPGAAARLINGEPIGFHRVFCSFTFIMTDEEGKAIDDPDDPGQILTKTIDAGITSFNIGVKTHG